MTMNAVPTGPEPDNKRPPETGGGGPPHDGGTDPRLAVLETRFDTILPTLATKSDLADLRLDMEKMRSELLEKLGGSGTELRGEISALGTGLRREMGELGTGLRGEIGELGSRLLAEIVKLRNEVHSTLMKAMMWFGALAMTVIFSTVGLGIYLSNQITSQVASQIDKLSARLPVASAPAAAPPNRSVPGALPPAQR